MNKQKQYKNDLDYNLLLGYSLHQLTKIKDLRDLYSRTSVPRPVPLVKHPVYAQMNATISSSDAPKSKLEKDDITEFVDSKASEEKQPEDLMVSKFAPFEPFTTQTIHSFLARPHITMDGIIIGATPVGLVNNLPIHDPFQTSPLIIQKLEGVYAMRYTTVLTLKINATRFQAGSLMMGWMPSGGFVGSSALRITTNYSNLMQLTQTMHVKANFAYDSTVTLRIPFASDRHIHANPIAEIPAGNVGHYFIALYSPLIFTTGSNNVPYTVYLHYEDVELYGSAIAQGDMSRVKMDPLSAEMFSKRPVSSVARIGASVADGLSKIPLFTPLAKPASWMMDAISRAAYIWGYSNPRVITPPIRLINSDLPNSCNSDSHNPAQPLGLSIQSHVGIVNGIGATDEDQMSVEFLKRRFSYFTTFDYATTDVAGAILATIDLDPSSYQQNSATAAAKTMTPICFLCQLASKWTGGLVFRFHLYKTPFHSGRIAFVYNPLMQGVTITPANLEQTEFMYKVIVDITDYNVVEVYVPYISTATWKSTNGTGTMGKLYIMVVDPLVTPADAASTFNINVEVAGASDFQIAQPRDLRLTAAVAQGAMDFVSQDLKVSMGGHVQKAITYAKNNECIGETMESLKNLLVTYRSVGIGYNGLETEFLRYQPFSFTYKTAAAITNLHRDHISPIAMCYAAFRGGMNVAFMSESATYSINVVSLISPVNDTVPATTAFGSRVSTIASVTSKQTLWWRADKSAPVVNVPFYSFTPLIPVLNCLYSLSTAPPTNTTNTQPALEVDFLTNVVVATIRGTIHRSTGDDFQFTLFCSIPVLIVG